MRGLARRSDVLAADAPALIALSLRMPIRRELLTRATADRIWQLRENMTAYDAGYVALAEQLTRIPAHLRPEVRRSTRPALRCRTPRLAADRHGDTRRRGCSRRRQRADHVDPLVFAVRNAKQAAHYYSTAFSTRRVAYRGPETGCPHEAAHVLETGSARFVFRGLARPGTG